MRLIQFEMVLCLAVLHFWTDGQAADSATQPAGPYAAWDLGPSSAPDTFPIAVWLQNPTRAAEYRKAGFNTYVGLWRGPTEDQLDRLRAAGMQLICAQNEVGMRHRDDPMIVGWMHGDEPDNAQSLGPGKGYGPPIPPADIVRDYVRIRTADPTRPVLLNLGQGVAWDNWHGRGTRTRHPEDYPAYVQGGDIISFDIYPAVHTHPEVAGNLWFVAQGVQRLRDWTQGQKIIWNCIECTRIQHPQQKPSPWQVRAEVWMSLIHGSQGLIYFVHEWEPSFNEAALLADPEMLAAVSALNHQILELAPILNTPSVPDAVRIDLEDAERPVATMVKTRGQHTYVFAVNLRGQPTQCTLDFGQRDSSATLIDIETPSRALSFNEGRIKEAFDPWEVKMLRLTSSR